MEKTETYKAASQVSEYVFTYTVFLLSVLVRNAEILLVENDAIESLHFTPNQIV